MSVLWAKRGWMSGGTFVPHQLFASGAQGAWYDPSDFSTLYQTSTGTTPVTAVEQPVGLMLDRSRGLVLGPELVTINSATLTGSTGYTAITGASCVAGRSYSVSYTCVLSGGTIQGVVGGTALTSTSVSGTFSFIVVATSSIAPQFYSSAGVGSISNYSIRELPGNHATAPNDASRPVLRARYNLLRYSEQFDDVLWVKDRTSITANAGVAPDGTTTAYKLVEDSTAANNHRIRQQIITIAASYTTTIYAKAAERSIMYIRMDRTSTTEAVWFDLAAGTVGTQETGMTGSITALPNGWYRCQATLDVAAAASNSILFGLAIADGSANYTGDGTSGILIWGAQLQTAADHAATGGAYQRIAAATDYDVSNPVWRPYLAFDGTDDSFGTSSIDFSATDEMTVFAGVTKLSDAASGFVAELSSATSLNNGSFHMAAPDTGESARFQFANKGTTRVTANATSNAYLSPITSVLTGIGDISGDVATLRIDGAQVATNTYDQGTGNFGNYPLYIGRRGGSSLPFNGRLYSLAVLGRTATAAEITSMEAWVAGKTGVTL